ncbi:MAG: KH domain-containing protein [Dehalococcoidales bacterium]|jgi:spoIIIJ-associated protein|nr:KH domain-containing protein [Dehalococcoidales bacterium]
MSELVEYGKVARDVLMDLLNQLEIEASIDMEESKVADNDGTEEKSMVLNIVGDDLGILIGRRGLTLSSLQYITRLIASQKTGINAPLVLDVNGYKQRRYESLQALSRHVADQVVVNHRSIALEPMPAYERRIVHMTLANNPKVTTQSTGFGDARKVVVSPAK